MCNLFTQNCTFPIIYTIFGLFRYSMSYTVLKWQDLYLGISVPVRGLVLDTRSNGIFTITFYLGSFPNLCKVVICFAITVRPSVRMKQLLSRWKGFHTFSYWGVILKSVKKIHIRLKHDENRRHMAHLWLFWVLALM